MATFTRFNSFVEALAEKVHNLGADTLTLALTAAANTPVNTNTQLSNLTQISYTNLSSRVVSIGSSSQSSGTYKLIGPATTVLTASGGSVAAFQFLVLYNDTATNDELIGWWDYASALTLNNGETLTITWDASEGIIKITSP